MEKAKSKRKGLTMRTREMLTGYIFILPAVIGLVFLFLPMLGRVVQYAFNDIYIPMGERYVLEPRGIDHFYDAFRVHPTFVRVLTGMVTDILWNVPLIIFFSLFMAILLNRQFPGRLLVRAIFFLPVVLAVPAIQDTLTMVMAMMAEGMGDMSGEVEVDTYFDAGAVAWMLIRFGVPIQFIAFVVGAVARLHIIIRSGGVQMLIFLAALQSIPTSMYEAAQVEGTTAYESFWKITLPMISPLIITNMVYTVVDMFAVSEPIAMAHTLAFGTARNFGLSAVFTLTSSAIVTLMILIAGFLISRKAVYLT